MQEWERDLRDLATADVVTLDDAGRAGETPTVFRAFSALARQLSPALRPRVQRLLEEATPAGRVYAAMLLSRLDPALGDEAWRRLADDHSPVEIIHGIATDRTTLAAFAQASIGGTDGNRSARVSSPDGRAAAHTTSPRSQ